MSTRKMGNLAKHRFAWLAPTTKQYNNGGMRLHIADCMYLGYGTRVASETEIDETKKCKHCKRRILQEIHDADRRIGWLTHYITELNKELS